MNNLKELLNAVITFIDEKVITPVTQFLFKK